MNSKLDDIRNQYNDIHFEIIEINNTRFAFDYKNLLLCKVDEIIIDILESIRAERKIDALMKKYDREDIINNINELNSYFKMDLFLSPEKPKIDINKKFDIGNISFPTIHKCNLRCKYCFAEHGENYKETSKIIDKEKIEKIINFVQNDYMKDCKRYRIDFVSGGEPLLNFDSIKNTYSIVSDKYLETGKKTTIWMCTNGTMFTEENLNFLNDSNIFLGVSIDGDKRIHDNMRIYANGQGTYNDVSHNIKKIIANRNYKRRLREIWGLTVVNSETRSLVDVIKHHKNIGLKSIQMKPVRGDEQNIYGINIKNIDYFKKMYKEFNEFLVDKLKQNNIDYLMMILNDTDFYGKYLKRLLLRTPVFYRCGAGKDKISITANGDIYPCDSFVGIEECKIGNIDTGIQDDKVNQFYEQIVTNRKICKDCWLRYICGGECYYTSYISNGNISVPNKYMCELTKYVIKLCIGMLYEISKNEDLFNNITEKLRLKSFVI